MQGDTRRGAPRRRGLRVVTACTTRDEFVLLFARLSDGDTIYLATSRFLRPEGSTEGISIQLADGSPALQGVALVVKSFEAGTGPYRRAGMAVRFVDIASEYDASLRSILAAARARVVALRASRAALQTHRTAAADRAPSERPPASPAIPDDAPRNQSRGTLLGMPVMSAPWSSSPAKAPSSPFLAQGTNAGAQGVLAASNSGAPLLLAHRASLVAPESVLHGGFPDSLFESPAISSKGDGIVPANPFCELDDEALRMFVDTSFVEEPQPQWTPHASSSSLFGRAPSALTRPESTKGWRALVLVSCATGLAGLGAGYVVFTPSRQEAAPHVSASPPDAALVASSRVVAPVGAPQADPAPYATAFPVEPLVDGAPPSRSTEVLTPSGPIAPVPETSLPTVPQALVVTQDHRPIVATDLGPGAGACSLFIDYASVDARVFVDGALVGPAPYRAAASCGAHTLRLEHPRYKPFERDVELVAGAEMVVRPRLERPLHTVTITSVPSGATVLVDGRSAGQTPLSLRLPGFQRAQVSVQRFGYDGIRRTLYVKKASERVAFKLVAERPGATASRPGGR